MREDGQGDGGFTLVETMVSLAIVAIVMLGLGAVFIATASGTDAQGSRQAAARIATDGLDQVRAVRGTAVVACRTRADIDTQWAAKPAAVATLLAGLAPAYDTSGRACATGDQVALPTTAGLVTVDGIGYTRQFYVAGCAWSAATNCSGTTTAATLALYDVVVAVSWKSTTCPAGTCVYTASTLVAASTDEPLFNSNSAAKPPVVAAVPDQVNDVGDTVDGPAVSVTGGNGTILLSAPGLPAGLALVDGRIRGTLTGAASTQTVTLSAIDQFGLVGTATFTWTVNAAPALTAATVAVTVGQTSIDLPTVLARTGGTGPYRWNCPGLPPTLTLDADTGVITGTGLALLGQLAQPCTVTDARARSATATLNLLSPLVVATPANGATVTASRTRDTSLALVATGCAVACGWSVDRLPAGLTLSAAGVISGRVTTPGTTTVVVTVRDALNRKATSTTTWRVS